MNNHELKKGETASLSCRPLGTDTLWKISWRKNGKSVKLDDRIGVTDENELVIKNVSQQDCGEYYCVARNGITVITSVGTLAIIDGIVYLITAPAFP